MDISCIILAGGKSLRLGHDKLTEKLGSSRLIEHTISSVDPLSKEVIIVTTEDRIFPNLTSHSKLKIESDIFPGKGSLGGIYTGLVKSSNFYNLVIAADMPFLNRSLLSYLIEVSEGFDYIIPKVNNLFEPLHAVYSKNCIEPIEQILKQGRKVIIDLFNYVKVKYVEAEDINRFDPRHLSFFNINTKEDLEKARKIAVGETNL